MSKRRLSPKEQWKLLTRITPDILDPEYPEELVDAELRRAGGDPEAIGRRGEAFVQKLLAERSRKESGTRLRSRAKVPSSLPPSPSPTTAPTSTLPPIRAKLPSETEPLDGSD